MPFQWCFCVKSKYLTLAAAVASRIQNEVTFCYAAPYTNWQHCTFCALAEPLFTFSPRRNVLGQQHKISVSALRVFGAERLIRTRRWWLNIPPALIRSSYHHAPRRAALWWETPKGGKTDIQMRRILLSLFVCWTQKIFYVVLSQATFTSF